jgi:hypothetical protein
MRTWVIVVLMSLGSVGVLSNPLWAQAPTKDGMPGQAATSPTPCTVEPIVTQEQPTGVMLTCVAPYGMTAPVVCPLLASMKGQYMHLSVDGVNGVGTYTCAGVDKLTGQAKPTLERYSTVRAPHPHRQGWCELKTTTSPPGQTVTATCVVLPALP